MQQTISHSSSQALGSHRVLRNTYALLSMTLLFSAAMATVAMAFQWPPLGPIVTLIGFYGLFFATAKLRNSVWGLVSVFALTGFMGATLGPILNIYMSRFANGDEIVILSLGGTGAIFLAMSAFALTTKKDLSGMGRFLMIGILVAFIAALANIFLKITGLALAVSSMFLVISSLLISYETQQIVRGGETNYIMATVSLFVSIYNIFVSLLSLLGFAMGED
ncbi:MAG: Bax inhibitor-1/YccA family protein [Xanthomonadales bacterium]|nr:Bax inhibitor-1/YccA family protein [Xanthomonadales bacterium]